VSWYLLMAAIGAWMADGGFRKSDAKPFLFLLARAQLLWKGRAHQFLGVSGVLIMLFGLILHFLAV
jgi:hypothetical protein